MLAKDSPTEETALTPQASSAMTKLHSQSSRCRSPQETNHSPRPTARANLRSKNGRANSAPPLNLGTSDLIALSTSGFKHGPVGPETPTFTTSLPPIRPFQTSALSNSGRSRLSVSKTLSSPSTAETDFAILKPRAPPNRKRKRVEARGAIDEAAAIKRSIPEPQPPPERTDETETEKESVKIEEGGAFEESEEVKEKEGLQGQFPDRRKGSGAVSLDGSLSAKKAKRKSNRRRVIQREEGSADSIIRSQSRRSARSCNAKPRQYAIDDDDNSDTAGKSHVNRNRKAPYGKYRTQEDVENSDDESTELQETFYLIPFILIKSENDDFYSGDICICGSRGCSKEDRLIFCSHCGEAYHEYCASGVTIEEVIAGKLSSPADPEFEMEPSNLEPGKPGALEAPSHSSDKHQSPFVIPKPHSWRCFNCLFCELCHDAEPESHLLVCDNCEKGFHTHCLVPPLDFIPQGKYLCPECVQCEMCGSRVPGSVKKCTWKRNYELCESCEFTSNAGPVTKGRGIKIRLKMGIESRRGRKRERKGIICNNPSATEAERDDRINTDSIRPMPSSTPDELDNNGIHGTMDGMHCSQKFDGKATEQLKQQDAGVDSEAYHFPSKRTFSPSLLTEVESKVAVENDAQWRPPVSHPLPLPPPPSVSPCPIDTGFGAQYTMPGNVCEVDVGNIEQSENPENAVVWPLYPGQVVFQDYMTESQYTRQNAGNSCQEWRGHEVHYAQPFPMVYAIPTGLPYAFQSPAPEIYALSRIQRVTAWAYVPYIPSTFGCATGVDGWADACAKQLRIDANDFSKRFPKIAPSDRNVVSSEWRSGQIQPEHDPLLHTQPVHTVRLNGQSRRQMKFAATMRSRNIQDPKPGFFDPRNEAHRKFSGTPDKPNFDTVDANDGGVSGYEGGEDDASKIARDRHLRVDTGRKADASGVMISKTDAMTAATAVHPRIFPTHFAPRPLPVPTYYSDTVKYSRFHHENQQVQTPGDCDSVHSQGNFSNIEDLHKCALCSRTGDDVQDGRLLYVDIGFWVHAQCAYWSEEVVYSPSDGGMAGVCTAVARGKRMKCTECGSAGASILCFSNQCGKKFHYRCARESGCAFHVDKRVYCATHGQNRKGLKVGIDGSTGNGQLRKIKGSKKKPGRKKVVPPIPIPLTSSPQSSTVYEDYFTLNLPIRLAVKSASTIPYFHDSINRSKNSIIRLGSLLLYNLGYVSETDPYHTDKHIYPVGYRVRRMYWSTLEPDRRCFYTCEIVERECTDMTDLEDADDGSVGTGGVAKEVEFVITPEEGEGEVIPFIGSSATGAWKSVVAKIRSMRGNSVYPANGINGEYMFGLTHPHIAECIERLPNAHLCTDYQFRYILPTDPDYVTVPFSPDVEWETSILKPNNATSSSHLPDHHSGCARSEPYQCRTKKSRSRGAGSSSRSHGVASSSSSDDVFSSAIPPPLSSSDSFSAQFNDLSLSNAAKYRQLRNHAKLHRVAPSRIAGLGLLAGRSYSKEDMIIEYIGEVIGQKMADRREVVYDVQRRGCYMFGLDYDRIVDATMKGNAARFINHCCDPNCNAKIITIDNRKKIVIFAKTDIEAGEELTYDYQFAFESAEKKIPCMCGASNCRKWMN